VPGQRGEEALARIDLTDRLAQPRGRDLGRDTRDGEGGGQRLVELREDRLFRAPAVDLREVGMSDDVDCAAPGEPDDAANVLSPDLLDGQPLPDPRSLVDRDFEDVVDGAEQQVPGVLLEEPGERFLPAGDAVDLEPKLHGQALALGVEDGVDVAIEIVSTTTDVVRHVPDLAGLREVVDVFREGDLVDASFDCPLHEALDRFPRVNQRLGPVLDRPPEVHVVID
jgi:hypothetical protein